MSKLTSNPEHPFSHDFVAQAVDVHENSAQQKFGNAKSISSSMFNDTAPTGQDYEKSARLNQFSGAAAISSADYYGRDEGGSNMDANDMMNRLSMQVRHVVMKIACCPA